VEEQERRVLRVRIREQGVRPAVPAEDVLRLHHFVVDLALDCTSSTLTHFFDGLAYILYNFTLSTHSHTTRLALQQILLAGL
jgi:hypothetical protein